MRFYSSSFPEVIKSLKSDKIKAVLFHGNNAGFISSAIEQISKNFSMRKIYFDFKKLSISQLKLEANSRNFFSDRQILKITNSAGVIAKDYKDFLTKNEYIHLPIFVANESLPPTGIRKFFESQDNLASIGCYYESSATISRYIAQILDSEGYQISKEARDFLNINLQGDNQLIKSEIGKLMAYCAANKTIEYEDAKLVISSDLLSSSEEMCIYFAKSDATGFLNEVNKIKLEGKNEILMLRAITRFFINIYIATSLVEESSSVEQAMKAITPPVFFKYIPDFKQIIRKYTSAQALRVIELLQNAEIEYKTNPKAFSMYKSFQLNK